MGQDNVRHARLAGIAAQRTDERGLENEILVPHGHLRMVAVQQPDGRVTGARTVLSENGCQRVPSLVGACAHVRVNGSGARCWRARE